MATIVGICGLVLAGFAVCLLAPFAVAILNQNIALIEGLGLFALGYALVAALVVSSLAKPYIAHGPWANVHNGLLCLGNYGRRCHIADFCD